MANFKTELTTQEFLKFYRNEPHIRNFSRGAIGIVLARISESQRVNGITDINSNWRKIFVDLRELDANELLLSAELGIPAHASKILEMTRTYDGISAETTEHLKNPNNYSDTILLHSNLSELQAVEGWQEAVADLISEIKGYERMPNDKYLIHLVSRAETV